MLVTLFLFWRNEIYFLGCLSQKFDMFFLNLDIFSFTKVETRTCKNCSVGYPGKYIFNIESEKRFLLFARKKKFSAYFLNEIFFYYTTAVTDRTGCSVVKTYTCWQDRDSHKTEKNW